MRIPSLALRNLARHRRRSLITGLAVAFGTLALVVLQGFVNNFVAHLQETTVLSGVGAIQVFRKGYLGASDPLKMAITDDAKLVDRIRSLPGVAGVAPRLRFDGLISNGSEATVFVATAIDPSLEYGVCPKRAGRIAPGGRALTPEDGRGAVVGRALADALHTDLGGTLVLQASGAGAATNALDASVQGFLPEVIDPNESRRTVTLPLAFAQNLLRMKGRVTEYAIRVKALEETDRIAAALRLELGNDFEVTTWRQLDPATSERTQVLQAVLVFVGFILLLLVGTGILNTMMMSVYERVREIGTMLAVGVRRRQISALFLWESAWLGLVAGSLGAVLGRVILLMIALGQPTWRAPGDELMTLQPEVAVGFLAAVITFGVVGTALAGLYPAWRASRLCPVEALRSN